MGHTKRVHDCGASFARLGGMLISVVSVTIKCATFYVLHPNYV